MKLNFYFFGDLGLLDEYNPAYVLRQKHVDEIIYLIGINEPYTITKNIVMTALKIDEAKFDEIVDSLVKIDAVEIKENRYRLKFPLYLKKDIEIISHHLRELAKEIGDEIISMKDIIYNKISSLTDQSQSKERLMYHIICDKIFDGTAFDYFANKELIATSLLHPNERDYIIVGYENNDYVKEYSDHLLCSSNNYVTSHYQFNSFGDSNGNRKDMYRYFRMIDLAIEKASDFNELNKAYISNLKSLNNKLVNKCGDLLKSIFYQNELEFTKEDKKVIKFLKHMEYLTDEKTINVPVFTNNDFSIIDFISEIVLNHISPNIEEFYKHFKKTVKNITPMTHDIPLNVIANELWHLIFGSVNEYLVEVGFVEKVQQVEGQGRYLRSLTIL